MIYLFTIKAVRAVAEHIKIVQVQKQRKGHLHTCSYICELMLMDLDIIITTAVMSHKINKQLSLCLIIVYFPGLTATELASKQWGVWFKDTSLMPHRLCKIANEPLLAWFLNSSDWNPATGYTYTDWCNRHQQWGGFIYVVSSHSWIKALWFCHNAWLLMTDRLFVVARMRSEQQIVGGRGFTRTSHWAWTKGGPWKVLDLLTYVIADLNM